MSAINLVKIYFLSRPKRYSLIRQCRALAYQTATDQGLNPMAILIRSGNDPPSDDDTSDKCVIHQTTWIDGRYQKLPRGAHLTLCFKDAEMITKRTHIASHAYVESESDWHIRDATHAREKPDSVLVRPTGRPAWPAKKRLHFEGEVGFGNLKKEGEFMPIKKERVRSDIGSLAKPCTAAVDDSQDSTINESIDPGAQALPTNRLLETRESRISRSLPL